MQSVSSRIWTRVAVSISYDDNHYTTGIMSNFQEDLIKEHGMTKEEGRLLCPCAIGIRCLNNNEVSLTWPVIRSEPLGWQELIY